jgi:hypothetical protein
MTASKMAANLSFQFTYSSMVGNLSALTEKAGSFLLELPFFAPMSKNINFRRIF